MGLLTAPFRGLLRVFEEVADRAERELYDGDAVRAELTELYFRLENGSLNEEQFDEREAELVQRLEEVEDRQRERDAGEPR